MRSRSVALLLFVGAVACGGSELDTDVGARAILGGRRSLAGEHPAVGAILVRYQYHTPEPLYHFFCSGSLIAPDVVLTAAHCLAFFDLDCPTPNHCERIEFADHRFSLEADVTPYEGSGTEVQAVTAGGLKYLQFPRYLQERHNIDDIGLLFLDKAFTELTPYEIVTPEEAMQMTVGSTVTIAGYGINDDTVPFFGTRHEASTLITAITAGEMQVGGRAPEARKCYGDSGSPTLLAVNGVEKIAGVTSRTTPHDSGCQRDNIDTRADAFLDWINEELDTACKEGKRATCIEPPAPKDGGDSGCTDTRPATRSPSGAFLPILMLIAILIRRR